MIIFFSCVREKEVKQKPVLNKETLQQINKLLVEKEADQIEKFVERREWDMKESQTGLWYMVYNEGTGSLIKKGNYITINYKVWLLDGSLIYSSDSLGLKSFMVGQGGVESGLEEGVLLLKMNSKARFIMPPHLAHGLMGDENRIPARASIIYDIEILKIE